LASFPTKDLILAGAFFCFGFLATNYSFQKSSAAFVETIKAAEPITSAATAVAWGIETISHSEALSLATVVLGVLMSTLGNTHGKSGTHTTMADNVRACIIVMTANLCFSFRGLHQKLFRATPIGNSNLVDDLNLQYRMQQIGMGILVVPAMLFDGPYLVRHVWSGVSVGSGVYYLGLALVNGFAFTSYK
jgi:drug/metabolite transporter (DMT)-like permease